MLIVASRRIPTPGPAVLFLGEQPMKSLPLFLIASVLSFNAYADDSATNCAGKIKELEDIKKTDGQAAGSGKAGEYDTLLKQAKEAQAKGDIAKCISAATRAKTIHNTARGS